MYFTRQQFYIERNNILCNAKINLCLIQNDMNILTKILLKTSSKTKKSLNKIKEIQKS